MKRLPKKGTLVQIEWIDATGYINVEGDIPKPANCSTVGWIHATKKDYVVLASSLYQDNVGDFTVLPRGTIQTVKLLQAKPAPRRP